MPKKKTKNKLSPLPIIGIIIGALIVILLLTLIIVLLTRSTGIIQPPKPQPKPHLTISSNFQDEWELGGRGCYGVYSGNVQNIGDGTANSVSVTCNAGDATGNELLGDIYPGNSGSFNIIVDYSCNNKNPLGCTETCDNC